MRTAACVTTKEEVCAIERGMVFFPPVDYWRCCDPVRSKLRVLWVLLVLPLLKNEGIVQGWCMGLHDLTLPLSEE